VPLRSPGEPHRQVLPGLHWLWFPGIDNNAFLLAGPALIDSGPPGGLRTVLAVLRRSGITAGAGGVRHVAVTHHHTDHTGSLAALASAAPDALVYAHTEDEGVVRSGADRPRGTAHGLVGWMIVRLGSGSSASDPAPVHVEVEDGEELPAAGGALRCIHTPGHTGGHVSFLWPRAGGVLLVGERRPTCSGCSTSLP
jgi:glyoxylase-like metal-dependent hydrolase (beta-lactamase superfamily II)